jgi:hypothetical protein
LQVLYVGTEHNLLIVEFKVFNSSYIHVHKPICHHVKAFYFAIYSCQVSALVGGIYVEIYEGVFHNKKGTKYILRRKNVKPHARECYHIYCRRRGLVKRNENIYFRTLLF